MFSNNPKLEVLESKLSIYEKLSKEMLQKLEHAVQTISDSSSRVAVVLERHENRLDAGEQENEAIMRLITRIEKNLDGMEDKIEKLSRFRWMTMGIGLVALILLQTQLLQLTFRPNGSNISPQAQLYDGLD